MSLLNQWVRIFLKDNTQLFDLSMRAQNDLSIPFEFVAAEDALYIAQDLPFNNLFFEIDTPNTVESALSIEIWEGKEWVTAKNIMDGTATQNIPIQTNAVPLAQDGVIQFIPDRDDTWAQVPDTTEENNFDLISDIEIYEKYWLRIKYATNLSAGTSIKKIGYAFCEDRQLTTIDPEIDNYLSSWASGKTDWAEQILLASEHVIIDLKSRGLIVHPGQILRFEDVSLATAYRTLAIIYNKLGPGFEFQRDNALAQYESLSSIQRFTFDKHPDGIAQGNEVFGSIGSLVR